MAGNVLELSDSDVARRSESIQRIADCTGAAMKKFSGLLYVYHADETVFVGRKKMKIHENKDSVSR